MVTIRSKAFSFSFSMNDLELGEAIFIRDYNVLISKSADGLRLRAYDREPSDMGLSTIHDLVEKLPEQALERAWRELPTKKRDIYFTLGCKGRSSVSMPEV